MGLFPEEFRVTDIQFTLRLETGAAFPEYLGPTLRGGFGCALRRVACKNAGGDCRTCTSFPCAYRALFESPGRPDVGEHLRFDRVPHPVVLRVPFPHRALYPRGSLLHVGVVLVGDAIAFLPEVLESLVLLGRRGLGRPEQTFSVEAVRVRRGIWPEVFVPLRGGDGLEPIGAEEILATATRLQQQPLQVSLETPVRIKASGRPSDLTARELCQAAGRRVWSLAELYCGATYSGQLGQLRGLLDSAQVSECRLKWQGWVRFSKRQNASVTLSGFVGALTLKAVPDEVLPFLLAGSLVHVGKHTLFGLGRYHVFPGEARRGRGVGSGEGPCELEEELSRTNADPETGIESP